ncbi:hypothetical protein PIB30_035899 [Stylosanthes scabra]|uniref:Uncharacterized protein n=1 Tax=Stylosanthes scabra TaxID=79078 RepID=A0ABU6VCK2_9FABA|nr:hypothetical protein [Stylosanthes scabra]
MDCASENTMEVEEMPMGGMGDKGNVGVTPLITNTINAPLEIVLQRMQGCEDGEPLEFGESGCLEIPQKEPNRLMEVVNLGNINHEKVDRNVVGAQNNENNEAVDDRLIGSQAREAGVRDATGMRRNIALGPGMSDSDSCPFPPGFGPCTSLNHVHYTNSVHSDYRVREDVIENTNPNIDEEEHVGGEATTVAAACRRAVTGEVATVTASLPFV